MDKKKHELLTSGQLIGLMVGFTIGPEFLKLPDLLVSTAYQDAWISAIVALIYPLYIVLIASYIAKKHPNNSILDISRKYLGKTFGNILNAFFCLQFLLYIGTIASEFTRITRIYIAGFLSPIKIIIFCLGMSAFASYKGLKTLGKAGELVRYYMIPVLLLTVFAFKDGNISNIKPVFQSGIPYILKASKDTLYFYTGFEALLLIHPFVHDNVNILKASLKAFATCAVIWVWAVFSTIVYLGVDIIPKSIWSFFLVFDSVNFPIINNVRYVFMFVWALVSFRIVSNYLFLSHSIISDLTTFNIKKIIIITMPLLTYYTYILMNDLVRKNLLNIISPVFVTFNILFLTAISLLLKFRKQKVDN
jgi:spore germination protein